MKLKIFIFLCLLGNIWVANAQDPLSIEPQIPFAGQNIDFLAESWVCYSVDIINSVVEVDGNIVRIFVLPNDVCTTITPIPPMSVTAEFMAGQISGLSEGIYTYELYRILDPNDFPPMPVDYSTYFVSQLDFEVRGAPEPTSVDTTSNLGIMALILLIMSISFVFVRKR
ncbi:hypothetical protein [Marinicella gelatinilytica]|uniref:hypothetical protein n=1 Tax=Marinicella gelatinilytica TaxID=2996017 RepID=UPI002260859C|nr:hypothetical protein [Marinicella gelatinilytica]MCX7545207.1 hypothetical protein [Marinicella gelatinilytica]